MMIIYFAWKWKPQFLVSLAAFSLYDFCYLSTALLSFLVRETEVP